MSHHDLTMSVFSPVPRLDLECFLDVSRSTTLEQWLCLQVSEELIRVAILWHELWHEGLEEASRLYFSEGNVKGMFSALEPLHQMMERGPQTLKETSFNQVRPNKYDITKICSLLESYCVSCFRSLAAHSLLYASCPSIWSAIRCNVSWFCIQLLVIM